MLPDSPREIPLDPRPDLPSESQLLVRLISGLEDMAVILLTPEGLVRSWNRGAQELKGYAAHEIIGQSFSRFYPSEALAVGHPQRELEIASAMGRFEEEGWRVRKDGSRFWARVHITALYDDEGDLEGFGKVTRDMTDRKQAEEMQANTLRLLESTARTDSLTGLANRRGWDEALAREVSRAKRTGEPLCVAVIDIDHFKAINDEHGHGIGDRFLKRCSFAWRSQLRGADLLARWGGEEFALILPDCELAAGLEVVERLRAKTPDDQTCSAGVAVWDGEEAGEDLLGRADRSMYQAKRDGRDQTQTARRLESA